MPVFHDELPLVQQLLFVATSQNFEKQTSRVIFAVYQGWGINVTSQGKNRLLPPQLVCRKEEKDNTLVQKLPNVGCLHWEFV